MTNRSFLNMIVYVAVISCLVSPRAIAEDVRSHSLEPGRWALMFALDDEDDRLVSFNNMTFAMKKHISAQSAVRLEAGLRLGHDEFEDVERRSEAISYPDTLLTDSSRLDHGRGYENYDIHLAIALIRYPSVGEQLNAYYGFGPTLGYRYDHRTVTDIRDLRNGDAVQSYSEERTIRTWSAGLQIMAGAEWFATQSVSLHIEYFARMVFMNQDGSIVRSRISRHEEYIRSEVSEMDTSSEGWRFWGNRVIIGASFYL